MVKMVSKNQYDLSDFDFTYENDTFVRTGQWLKNTRLPIPYVDEDNLIEDMCKQGFISPERAEKIYETGQLTHEEQNQFQELWIRNDLEDIGQDFPNIPFYGVFPIKKKDGEIAYALIIYGYPGGELEGVFHCITDAEEYLRQNGLVYPE